MSKRILSSDEIARRGEELYRSRIAPTLSARDTGQLVLIDVVSEDYEIGADEMEAAERLRERRPQGQVWFRRVGADPTVRRYSRRFRS